MRARSSKRNFQRPTKPEFIIYEIFKDVNRTTDLLYNKQTFGYDSSYYKIIQDGKFSSNSLTTQDGYTQINSHGIVLPEKFHEKYINRTNYPNGLTISSFFKVTHVFDHYCPGWVLCNNPGAPMCPISIWIRPTANNSVSLEVYGYTLNDSFPYFKRSNYPLSFNTWHHMAFTWYNNVGYLWINGTLISTINIHENTLAQIFFVRTLCSSLACNGYCYDMMLYDGCYFGTGSTIAVPTKDFDIYL